MSDTRLLTKASGVKEEVASSDTTGTKGDSTSGGDKERYAAAAAAALAKGDKRSNVAGFLVKAYQIFDNPVWSEICGWGQGGETVVIRKQIDFAQTILPLFFSHSNLQSFVRQLNMYNFRKVMQDPNSGEFKHDLFRKGNEHLLHKIKRKQSAAGAASESKKYRVGDAASGTARMAGGIVEEADNVLDELVELRKWKEEMANTVKELKRDKQTIQSENDMLKEKVAEHDKQQQVLQTKMQKILCCMYEAYISGLRGASGALTAPKLEEGSITDVAGVDGGSRIVAAGAAGGVSAGRTGTTAESALEKALQQLAALAGENMSSRINLLDMNNPWAGGGGAGGSDVATASSNGDSLGIASVNGAVGAGGVGGVGGMGGNGNGNGVIVGGGQLKRNRTWSQSSLDWLRSLRGTDPLGSIGTPGSSPAREAFSTSAGAPAASDHTADNANDHAAAAAAVEGGKNALHSLGNNGSGSFTPDRETSKRQRLSPPGVSGDAGIASVSPALSLALDPPRGLPPPRPKSPPASPEAVACAPESPADGGGGVCVAGSVDGAAVVDRVTGDSSARQDMSDGSHERAADLRGSVKIEAEERSASFHPDAPLASENSIASILNAGERRSVAAAGGDGGSGEIWGGGRLCRKLSQEATQMVNEFGELETREGEALTKLDSLSYQLASLMDNNPGFDGIPIFGEAGLVDDLVVSGDDLTIPAAAAAAGVADASAVGDDAIATNST